MNARDQIPSYQNSQGLSIDINPLVMAQISWKNGLYDQHAVFHFSKSDAELKSIFDKVTKDLAKLEFDPATIRFLGQQKEKDGQNLFEESFLNYLQRLNLQCELSLLTTEIPMIKIQGPLLQVQLAEIVFSSLKGVYQKNKE